MGEAELLHGPDEPLGGVVLPPLNGVAVIRWEFVMEVVVSFAQSDQGSEDMITGRVAIIERLVSEPMGKGVDTES
jgi:hypothetical protein